MVIESSKHTKWVEYFNSIAEGEKIWLPHAVEKEGWLFVGFTEFTNCFF